VLSTTQSFHARNKDIGTSFDGPFVDHSEIVSRRSAREKLTADAEAQAKRKLVAIDQIKEALS
jgi:hypothetical protein